MTASHEPLREHARARSSSDRAFGLTVGGILAAIGGLRALFSDAGIDLWSMGFLAVGAVLVMLGLTRPASLALANRGWTKLGLLLARLVNPIVLALIYVITILPIGLIMRAMGKRPLTLAADPDLDTYWITREPSAVTEDGLRNQF